MEESMFVLIKPFSHLKPMVLLLGLFVLTTHVIFIWHLFTLVIERSLTFWFQYGAALIDFIWIWLCKVFENSHYSWLILILSLVVTFQIEVVSGVQHVLASKIDTCVIIFNYLYFKNYYWCWRVNVVIGRVLIIAAKILKIYSDIDPARCLRYCLTESSCWNQEETGRPNCSNNSRRCWLTIQLVEPSCF